MMLSTSKSVKATSYNPLVRIKGVDTMDLSSASYHSAPSMDRLYYVVKNASSHVVTEPLMPWEWTEAQGIGTCAATSVWFALRFYYQALAYENDLRLSMLDQAISDLKELQDKVEDLERQLNAHYQGAWEAFKKAHKDYKKQRFDYDQSPVKDLALAKDNSKKSLHLRRTIISMALNEILRNLIVWHHELGDIATKLLFDRSKGELFTKTTEYSKMMQRREVLADAIPQSMASFHNFWKLQEEKYEERQKTASGKEAASSSVLDSWHSIREDVRTMYNDAIRVLKSKSASEMVLAKEAFVAQKFKPIDVKSLDEHSSLEQILGYIINFGDSPALREAISEHIEKHTENANAAKYLIVLYACLTKDVPLLDHLVVQQKLPLRYTIDTKKKDPKEVSMYYRDLKAEQSIAAFAAHEFVQHGQPLDAFPELFAISKKETKGIINKFKDAYKEIAPIISVEKLSQDDIGKAFRALLERGTIKDAYEEIALIIDAQKPLQNEIDEAFKDFVERGPIAVVAYILPKVSKKVVSNVFIETDNVKVLRLLIDLVKDSELLNEKIETNIIKNNVKIVEFLLPPYLRFEKWRIEKDLIQKQRLGSDITGELAVVRILDRLLNIAYTNNAMEGMQLLASFCDNTTIKDVFSRATKSRKSEMAHALAKYLTDDAIFTMIEEAKISNQGGLAKALFEEYAHKSRNGAMFLKAVEEGNLDELEKWMPSVSTSAIGYALLVAAEKGKMDCFERLIRHSTDEAIDAALSKLSDENLSHPSVLKAANNAYRYVAYKEISERAIKTSNAKLVVHILPFIMSISELDRLFKVACKDKKSFEIVEQLFQFASNYSIDVCFKIAIERELENQAKLLLPRVRREKLAEISHLSGFEKFGEDTQQAIKDRVNRFPTEVSIELAFLPRSENIIRDSLKAELEKYKADLACKDQQSCIDVLKSMNPSARIFPIEQAIERLLRRKEDSATLEELLSFATPNACTVIASNFAKHGSEKAIRACTKKALKADLLEAAVLARKQSNFELVTFVVPFLPLWGIVEFLEQSSSEQINAKYVKEIFAELPSDLASDALRIAVRGDGEARSEIVHYLLPKASPAAIDEAYLFAKRIKFDDEALEKAASETAKAQGKEIERAVGAK